MQSLRARSSPISPPCSTTSPRPRRRPFRTGRGRCGAFCLEQVSAATSAPGRLAGQEPPDLSSPRRRRTSAIRTSFTTSHAASAIRRISIIFTCSRSRRAAPTQALDTWKARLFEEFYERTKRALRRAWKPRRSGRLIRETQENARRRFPRFPKHASPRCGRNGPRRIFCASRRGNRLAHDARRPASGDARWSRSGN